MMTDCDVAIVGAGPYGLSAAAHLAAVKGLSLCVFGRAMSFWKENMPTGMFLRSGWSATHIADPGSELTLEAFEKASGQSMSKPVPLAQFVDYGRWFQNQAVPGLDPRSVRRVERASSCFRLTLEDGEMLTARRVIVACGIKPFAWTPSEFRYLPLQLASHSTEHHDLRIFAGKRVIVIGGGQSALESAALLREAGAEAEVIARTGRIHWLQGWASTALHYRMGKRVKRLLYAPTDVGPAGVSQLMARPDLLRKLPRGVQDKLSRRSVRPAGSGWLKKRLEGVPVTLGRSVISAAPVGDRVRMRLDDGKTRVADHVLLGTGFRVDISKYEFLDPALLQSIQCSGGYPCLAEGLETSIPGLHILGAPGAWSFGPLMQFVSGARYASLSLLRCINGTLPTFERRGQRFSPQNFAAVANRAMR